VTASSKHDALSRVLGSLPRHEAPAIPVDRLFRRVAWKRARIATLLLVVIGAPLFAFLLLRQRPGPPVHLRLRVIDVTEPIELPTRNPPELNLP
jgi:hypothetical protein